MNSYQRHRQAGSFNSVRRAEAGFGERTSSQGSELLVIDGGCCWPEQASVAMSTLYRPGEGRGRKAERGEFFLVLLRGKAKVFSVTLCD